jgi:hypothetical protein
MKKTITLLLMMAFCAQTSFAQYFLISNTTAKANPDGINTDSELPFTAATPNGWKQILGANNTAATWSPKQALPFGFNFGGSPVTDYKVSSSGIMTFDANSTLPAADYASIALPSALVPDASVCILGIAGIGANDLVLTKVFGKAPNRQCWIQFNSYGYGTVISDGTNYTYWGIVLEETTNNIYVVDQRTGGYATTKKVSVGVQTNATTAISVSTSPDLLSIAGADATPIDNGYYTFKPGTQPDFDMAATEITTPFFAVLGNNPIEGTLKNIGSKTITSYDINYKVDGGDTITANIKGVNIASLVTAKFSHPKLWNATKGGHTIEAWASNLNGNKDANPADDKITKKVFVVTAKVQRKPLLEVYTGSTCPPCTPGNANFHSIVDAKPADDYVAIKFQQNFPGTGDPYSTTESVNRRGFYAINSIPRMEIDGGWDGNANGFTEALYSGSRSAYAQFRLEGTYNIDTSFVSAKIQYSPLFDATSARVYVAIIENKTTKNVKSNGEKEFFQVMKKMLPNENGTLISNLVEGKWDTLSLSFLFKGKYRLSADGAVANRIDHTKEHSVEEFSDLRVVAWVQSTGSDKQVYQALNLSKKTVVGAQDLPISINSVLAYPNPATDVLNISLKADHADKLTLLLISADGSVSKAIDQDVTAGNNQLQLNTSELATGLYYLSIIDSKNNSHTQAVVIER